MLVTTCTGTPGVVASCAYATVLSKRGGATAVLPASRGPPRELPNASAKPTGPGAPVTVQSTVLLAPRGKPATPANANYPPAPAWAGARRVHQQVEEG